MLLIRFTNVLVVRPGKYWVAALVGGILVRSLLNITRRIAGAREVSSRSAGDTINTPQAWLQVWKDEGADECEEWGYFNQQFDADNQGIVYSMSTSTALVPSNANNVTFDPQDPLNLNLPVGGKQHISRRRRLMMLSFYLANMARCKFSLASVPDDNEGRALVDRYISERHTSVKMRFKNLRDSDFFRARDSAVELFFTPTSHDISWAAEMVSVSHRNYIEGYHGLYIRRHHSYFAYIKWLLFGVKPELQRRK
jgi:hypothetical protein